jgi:hypothetical protein
MFTKASTPWWRALLGPIGCRPNCQRHRWLLRTRSDRPSGCRAADKGDELAPFQIDRIAFRRPPLRVDLQNIELVGVSQEVLERFYDLSFVAHSARCPSWVIRVPVGRGCMSIHARSTLNTSHKFDALTPVANACFAAYLERSRNCAGWSGCMLTKAAGMTGRLSGQARTCARLLLVWVSLPPQNRI